MPQGAGRSLKDILAEADAALYRAKQSGRDRVIHFQETFDAPLPAAAEQS